ncbi:ABC transporter ATP-binding protein [Allonocardiopsis opalescens]|uniref:Iron complex transport system ATP-binding protein n=1 Tax=Allonocardiopsis opalescens TaxID=1144618 RepID=A0A2T0QDX5_9ACTN|nr:ABC transporter ATP-binding protein [Allonocardiopsis opalescens]PRY02144.1 iron complex transport system ATP-binding protein [Allonocardiopsis opalescens]
MSGSGAAPPAGSAGADDTGGFALSGLAVGYARRRFGRRAVQPVLSGLTATARRGEFTVLLGPNGTGKSTLLRTLAGLQPPLDGTARLDGVDLAAADPDERARRLAVVLTEREVPGLLTGGELVALGRHPHTGYTGRLTAADHVVVRWALGAMDAAHLAGRRVAECSDGERQRLFTARALAQQPSAILLDEPTAFLDVSARVALTGLLRRLAREQGVVVVASTHDLELALRVADTVWLLDHAGRLHTGTPEELTAAGLVGTVFTGDDLVFEPGAGVFTVRGERRGTAAVDAPADLAPLLRRALERAGWRPRASGDTGPADLAVAAGPDGYRTELDGAVEHHPTLGALTRWAAEARPPRP